MTDDDTRQGVVIAEDHPLISRGLVRMLAATRYRVLATVTRGDDLVRACRDRRPDLALVDVELADGESFAHAERVAGEVEVVFYTGASSQSCVQQALGMKARGVLSKEADPASLPGYLERAARGEFVVDEYTLQHLTAAAVADDEQRTLTAREREVVLLVAHGLTNHRIGARLGISTNTVKTLLSRVREKLGAADRASTVSTAIKRGEIDPQ